MATASSRAQPNRARGTHTSTGTGGSSGRTGWPTAAGGNDKAPSCSGTRSGWRPSPVTRPFEQVCE
ncbi:hypothetical protein GCM10027212_30020 [Actinotalea caeni]